MYGSHVVKQINQIQVAAFSTWRHPAMLLPVEQQLQHLRLICTVVGNHTLGFGISRRIAKVDVE